MASLVVGIAAAATRLVAGVAGLVAGPVSIAAGEYVSVELTSGDVGTTGGYREAALLDDWGVTPVP